MPYKDPAVRKAKHKEYSKNYYEKNKQKVIAKSAIGRKKFADKWRTFKETLTCSKCGFSHPAAIDFHHVNPKEKEIGLDRLARNCAWDRIEKELAKCIVLCANCHRIHHYEERKKPAL